MKNNSFLYKSILTSLLFISVCACSKDSSTEPRIDELKLNNAFSQADQFSGLKSLVVSKDGVIIKEQFWRTGGADKPHDVRSVTKTVMSLLIGIAIDKGYIQSADQTIGEYFQPIVTNLTEDKANIKIRDLLTMSSGFIWNELTQDMEYYNWISSNNQVQYLFNRSLAAQPGQTFNYNTAALHLLSVILTRATNIKTEDFAKQYLFDQLGIKQNYWEKDRQGYNNGGAGLNITPHDMIKIGQLILNRGKFDGKQIVSPEWIDQSVAIQKSTNNAQLYGPGYGYGLWIGQNESGNYAFANGWGGQFIVIIPKLNLVVTATNNWSDIATINANQNWYQTIDLIMTQIVPAFK